MQKDTGSSLVNNNIHQIPVVSLKWQRDTKTQQHADQYQEHQKPRLNQVEEEEQHNILQRV